MYTLLSLLVAAFVIALASCEHKSPDGTTTKPSAPTPAAPVNTGGNRTIPTTPPVMPPPQQQPAPNNPPPLNPPSPSEADLQITSAVRTALINDASLSFNDRSVTITTLKGVVTLRGKVESITKKDTIVGRAKSIAGVVRVDDQLEIKAP